MAEVKLPQHCYDELEQLVKETIEDKKARGINPKTTFGEIIQMLIIEHQERSNIPLIHQNGLAQTVSEKNEAGISTSSPASPIQTGDRADEESPSDLPPNEVPRGDEHD